MNGNHATGRLGLEQVRNEKQVELTVAGLGLVNAVRGTLDSIGAFEGCELAPGVKLDLTRLHVGLRAYYDARNAYDNACDDLNDAIHSGDSASNLTLDNIE